MEYQKLVKGINLTNEEQTKSIIIAPSGSAGTTTILSSQTANRTLTLPDATDTIVARETSETLKNKTINGPDNTITNISLTASVSGVLPIANGGTNSSTTLNNNRILQSAGGSIVEASAITASRVLVSDSNGIPTHSSVTTTTLGFLDASSSIQNQINSVVSTANAAATKDLSNLTYPTAFTGALTSAQGSMAFYSTQNRGSGTSDNSMLTTGSISGAGNSGDTIIATGAAASGNSGNIIIGTGTASGTKGYVSIEAPTVRILNESVVRLYEATGNGTNYVGLKAPSSVASDVTFTLPGADGSANYVIKTDGSGNLSFVNPATFTINFNKESFTLNGTDITNQYIDLAQVILANSLHFMCNALIYNEGVDYTVSLTGGAGGKTRVTFAGDLATGGVSALASSDVVYVKYAY